MAKTISKSALKAKMLEHFRQVGQTGEELIVTDDNRPLLKVVPFKQRPPSLDEVFADLRGKARYTDEDLLAPTIDEWSET